MSKKIVLVNNDVAHGQFVSKILIDNGYETEIYADALDYLAVCAETPCDLVISSYTLANMDGESFFKQIREYNSEIPVIFLYEEHDISLIASLLKYAHCDVMVKPVVTEELMARVRVMLAPTNIANDSGDIVVKTLSLNYKSKKVFRGKREITLTPKEFSLLEYLILNKNAVLSRNSILNKVWGTTDVSDRIVDVYIGYLREKIDSKYKVKLIETVPGFGYVIKD